MAAQARGLGDLNKAQSLFEQSIRHAPAAYQGRALAGLASVAYYRRDEQAEAGYLAEAMSAGGRDPYTIIQVSRALAIKQAVTGDHERALKALEGLYPLVRAYSQQQPRLYFDYLNSLAVELGRVGRLEEAQSYISLALASAFASVVPEYQQTAVEIRQKQEEQASAPLVAIPELPCAGVDHQEPDLLESATTYYITPGRTVGMVCPGEQTHLIILEQISTCAPIRAPSTILVNYPSTDCPR